MLFNVFCRDLYALIRANLVLIAEYKQPRRQARTSSDFDAPGAPLPLPLPPPPPGSLAAGPVPPGPAALLLMGRESRLIIVSFPVLA
jgi:hypothetical protein